VALLALPWANARGGSQLAKQATIFNAPLAGPKGLGLILIII